MLRVPLSNPALKRTLRPLYANHQATPYAGFFDPAYPITFDIYPGTVMTRKAQNTPAIAGEIFVPYTATAGQIPFGLSALFIAPTLGVNEMTATGTNLFTVWVGGQDAVFEILAPAFDPAGTWTLPTDGSIKYLTATNQGKLTTVGSPTKANSIAELVDVVSATKIVVRLRQVDA